MPGAKGITGHFTFDVISGKTVSDGLDKIIWGIQDSEEYTFDLALSKIHPDFRQLFYDKSLGSIGKIDYVDFKLKLYNGNYTQERYRIIGHSDDYEFTKQPTLIKGATTLLDPSLWKKAV